jgi:phage terminase small subunit
MPRKSAEALAGEYWRRLKAPPPPPHPKPPAYLNERAKAIWHDVVHSRPSDYFDVPNQHLLAGFCFAAATADVVADLMAQLDPTDVKQRRRWNTLQIMAGRQSKLMLTLATKLRLLPTKAQAERALQEAEQAVPLWERHK